MKKSLIIVTILLLLIVCVTAFAGTPKQNKFRYQANSCLGLSLDTPFTISGTVASIGSKSGLVIQVSEGVQEVVYGLGARWYWDAEEVDRLEVGDVVTVTGYTFPFSDATRNIAFAISILGDPVTESIELRNPVTGCPLWRGSKKH